MDWLTPPLAIALGAAIAAISALIGVLIKGGLDARVTSRQLETQRAIAIAQIQTQEKIAVEQIRTQERIAVANRAEGRALGMLDHRRTRYAEVVELAVAVTTALVRQRELLSNPDLPEYPSPVLHAEWTEWNRPDATVPISDAARAYGEIAEFDRRLSDANHALKRSVLPIHLIAPDEVVTLAAKLVGRDLVTEDRGDAAGAAGEIARQTQVLAAFMSACRTELGEARPVGAVIQK